MVKEGMISSNDSIDESFNEYKKDNNSTKPNEREKANIEEM